MYHVHILLKQALAETSYDIYSNITDHIPAIILNASSQRKIYALFLL